MKQFFIFYFSLFTSSLLHAQLYTQAGSSIYMSNGGLLTISNSDCKLNSAVEGNSTSKIIFTGSRAQTLDANSYSIYALDVDNSYGLQISSNVQVSNALTLSNGIITTGTHIVYAPSTATVSRQNGWVNGYLKKYIAAGNNITASFETGDDAYYTPASFTFSTVTSGGDISVKSAAGADGVSNYTDLPLSKTNYINRYWQLSAEDVLDFDKYDATLSYVSADIKGTAGTSLLKAGIYNYGWNIYPAVSGSSYQTTVSGIAAPGNMLLAADDDTGSTIINIKAYLQGYYTGSGQMQPVLLNQGVGTGSTETDSITVELHNETEGSLVASAIGVLNTDGTAGIEFPSLSGSYYISIRHRNSIETWSAAPVSIGTTASYDFTTSASQAYGDNMTEVETGIWAIYSGDINQDGAIDAFDYLDADTDIQTGAGSAYLLTDINGDGAVDAFDYLVIDPHIQNGIGIFLPF